MATHKPFTTRSSSTDSSALSNLDVSPSQQAAVATVDDSTSDRVSASTPPTSLPEIGTPSLAGSGKANKKMPALREVEEEESGRRPKRARSGVSTYNLKKLSDAQLPVTATASSSRNVSGLTGKTLVEGQEQPEQQEGTPFAGKVEKALDMEWEISVRAEEQKGKPSAGKLSRRPSVKDRVKKMAGKVGSVLGKRGREVLGAAKRKGSKKEEVQVEDEEESEEEEELPRWKKELDTGTRGLLDEMDLDADVDMPVPPPAKKVRLSGKAPLQELAQPTAAPIPVAKASSAGKRMKKWQKEGLYVGQDPDFDPTQPGGRKKLQKKRPGSSTSDAPSTMIATTSGRALMGLPMFSYLDKTRDFTIPYDVFAPSYRKGDEKPKDWHQLNKNRLVGEARELWEKAEKLPASMCVCTPASGPGEQGCDEDCLNRVMQYECNDDNCNLAASECSNRAFSSLATRMKKGGAYDVGVEVIKTDTRGFGVRSCRTFAPGQIIMEYTGEIITDGECQRRMRELYKDKQCYYLMELERGLIIDGTKGSMARFINHSCEPNCEVRMVKVDGTPRMGVFAGEDGIATGEELTYDYNFDNFGETRQVCYCGAPGCRGFLSKRLNASEVKKAVKEEIERKRKAAEEAQKHAADEERKKKTKTDRGSSWRGWVLVDDPETKERLKQEKREKEEAAKSSDRARRMAARRGSLPAAPAVAKASSAKKSVSKRRKTTAFEAEEVAASNALIASASSDIEDDDDEEVAPVLEKPALAPAALASSRRSLSHARTTSSSGSKFTEDLPRPSTSTLTTASCITRKTEISITEVQQESLQREVSAVDSVAANEGENEKATGTKSKRSSVMEAAKSVGQAVKSGLLKGAGAGAGIGRGKKEGGVEKGGSGGGKTMRQSTLSFARRG